MLSVPQVHKHLRQDTERCLYDFFRNSLNNTYAQQNQIGDSFGRWGREMCISLIFSAVMVFGVVFMARFLTALVRECRLPKRLVFLSRPRNSRSVVLVNNNPRVPIAPTARDLDGCHVAFVRERTPEQRRAAILTMEIRSLPFRDQYSDQPRRRARP
jgi:hypothetical protein